MATYIGAKIGDRLLGSVRIIRSHSLPIEKSFSYQLPPEVQHIDSDATVELSRLVIERTPADEDVPRNIVMLFLADIGLLEAQTKGSRLGVMYLKNKLLNKMRLLRLPIRTLQTFTCTYPQDGPMAPYFFNQPDNLVTPGYFVLEEIEAFLHTVLRNKNIFSVATDGKTYSLKKSMYNRFLSSLGIL